MKKIATTLLFLGLVLNSTFTFAKQATYALVAPLLNYSLLEEQESKFIHNLTKSLYQASRNGISQQAIELKNLGFNLSFNEASAPSSEYEANITKFYTLTNKDKNAWLKKQKIQGLYWFELPSELTDKEQICLDNNCKLPLSLNFYFPNEYHYSFNHLLAFDAKNLDLNKALLEEFSQLNQDFLAQIWNSCALREDKKNYPLTLCAKNKKQLEVNQSLDINLLEENSKEDLNELLLKASIDSSETEDS